MGGGDPLAALLTRPGALAELRLRGAGWLLAAQMLAALAGCEAVARGRASEARDSAGVRIIESTGPVWATGDGWRLSPSLELDVAASGTTPEHTLREVVGAVRLSNGTLAVADAAARDVRFFGPDGRFLYRALGKDGVPPTFSVLGSLSRGPGDTLLAFDPEARLVFVIAPDGVVARQVALRWSGDAGLDRAASFQDGSFAVRTAWRPADVPVESGVGRAPIWFVRFASDGALLDTIAAASGPAVGTVSLGAARTFVSPLLGAVTVQAVYGDRLYVGTGEAFELRAYASDARLIGVVRVPGADLGVTLEELDAARAERAATARGNPVAERLIAQLERALPAPESRPAYADLLVDGLGNLWVGEYPWTGPGGSPPRTPRIWTVFDDEGRMLGPVETPEGLQLLEVGADHVLALRRDGSAAQSVVLYRLTR